MKEKELLELMSNIDDGLIEDSVKRRRKKKNLAKQISIAVGTAACAVLVVGAVFLGGHFTKEPEPVLPVETGEFTGTEETETTEDTTSNAIGGAKGCPVHCEEYHFLPYDLVEDFKDEFDEWSAKASQIKDDSGCLYPGSTIKTLIDEFDIPKEKFKEVSRLFWSNTFDIDLLYSDDYKAIDEYYRDFESRGYTMERQDQVRKIKNKILDARKDNTYCVTISISELVGKYDISKDELNETIKEVLEEEDYNYAFTYKVDELFDGKLVLADEDGNPLSVAEQDAAFCGIDNWYTD